MNSAYFYYLLRRGIIGGGGGVWAKIVNDFKARVIADGGTMESPSCAKNDVKYLVENPEPVAFTGLLNDYSGAAAAYSLRLLDNTYTGDAIVVRRASDNATQGIGFVNNELDTATLESFCSGTDGFVTTWYDQSGNGNDAAQTTSSSQPKIVSSGSTILENGKAAVQFGGSNDNLIVWNNTTAPTLFQDMSDAISVLLVEKATAISNSSSAWFNGNTTFELRENSSATGAGVPFNIGYSSSKFGFGVTDDYLSGNEVELSATITSAQRLSTSFVNGDDLDVYLNSSSAINTTFTIATGDRSVGTGNSTLAIGSRSRDGGPADSSYFLGTMQEIVLYKSNESANRTGIETNINDFYSIY